MRERLKYGERLCDAFSFRLTPSQRRWLEEISEQRKIGLCEAARLVLDEGMARAAKPEDPRK